MLLLPDVDETPASFPAVDLYEFRLCSLGTQVIIWATIGLVFARLITRVVEDERDEASLTA